LRGRDGALETEARELLRSLGAKRIATELRVEWNPRLQTAAGRADYRQKRISLNPRLAEHPEEVDRTLRHELAHILAQFRAGRRRISPHGPQWQQACCDLGIAGEKRCHTLPFPAKRCAPRFIYRCPNCRRDFPRVRKIKRTVACLACCRAHNRGEFDVRFRLKIVRLGRRAGDCAPYPCSCICSRGRARHSVRAVFLEGGSAPFRARQPDPRPNYCCASAPLPSPLLAFSPRSFAWINISISPSITACTLLVSAPVRWSLTI